MLNLLPRDLLPWLSVDYSPSNTYQDVMLMFAIGNSMTTESLSWILHRPWAPFADYDDWPTWLPNLGLAFSTAHFY